MESTKRKIDAISQTHRIFEELRHDLSTAAWAWTPEVEQETKLNLGASKILYVDGKEYVFSPKERVLYVEGKPRSGSFREVCFWSQEGYLSKFCVACDRSKLPPTRRPKFRECSTLVSKVFLEIKAENQRSKNHVYEESHAWCVMGAPIHYGFKD